MREVVASHSTVDSGEPGSQGPKRGKEKSCYEIALMKHGRVHWNLYVCQRNESE
jgi:hypothetical protein